MSVCYQGWPCEGDAGRFWPAPTGAWASDLGDWKALAGRAACWAGLRAGLIDVGHEALARLPATHAGIGAGARWWPLTPAPALRFIMTRVRRVDSTPRSAAIQGGAGPPWVYSKNKVRPLSNMAVRGRREDSVAGSGTRSSTSVCIAKDRMARSGQGSRGRASFGTSRRRPMTGMAAPPTRPRGTARRRPITGMAAPPTRPRGTSRRRPMTGMAAPQPVHAQRLPQRRAGPPALPARGQGHAYDRFVA
jgi:hypothetical protein